MLFNKTAHTLYSKTLIRHFTAKPLLSLSLSRPNSSSAATSAATDIETINTASSPQHPWPEWVSFIDTLKSRGYFPPSSSSSSSQLGYLEHKLVKEPCFSFARDRFDVFNSLSKDDIKSIVEIGCPKLVRKVINSAKRLREYVGLEEKNVCDVCSLRESCDRAYLKPNDSESVRTLDIMRLILSYALDPMIISGAVKPTSIEQVESSARRLLSMLIELSESSKCPDAVEIPYKGKVVNSTATVVLEAVETSKMEWVCPKCNFFNFKRNIQCRECNEDRPKTQETAYAEPTNGYWNCSKCNFLNYPKNIRCRQCHEDSPKKREDQQLEPKTSSWHCPKCKFLNFPKNNQCKMCKEDAPEKRESEHVELKTGDWNCPQCQRLNFARRTICHHCTATRPLESLKPGEWVCSMCNYLNFRRNAKCLKCETIKKAASQDDHQWAKPTSPSTS